MTPKYAVYKGNPRVDKKAKKYKEFDDLDEALNEVAKLDVKGIEAYVVEQGGLYE